MEYNSQIIIMLKHLKKISDKLGQGCSSVCIISDMAAAGKKHFSAEEISRFSALF